MCTFILETCKIFMFVLCDCYYIALYNVLNLLLLLKVSLNSLALAMSEWVLFYCLSPFLGSPMQDHISLNMHRSLLLTCADLNKLAHALLMG